jgi:Domain of unknown function (DUF4434)
MGKLLIAFAIGYMGAPAEPQAQSGPVLRGTFLQLGIDQQWNDARLRKLFADFRRLGVSHVVVQWTVVGNKAFYRSAAFESVPEGPLEPLLTMADEFGMMVRVGLAYDPEFWDRIKLESPPRDLEQFLQRSRNRSISAARELLPVVGRHRSFEGWFLTEEIDDVNWLPPQRRALLHSYLGDLRRALHTLGSTASVAVSGFSNANCDPLTLEAFWSELLKGTNIDTVFFQDGVGAHKLDFPYLSLYLSAIKRAATGMNRALSIVAELFDQIEGPPVSAGAFRAVPTTVDRLARQLTLDSDASTDGVFAFSVPDYMVPEAGPQAQRLFTDYIQRFRPSQPSPQHAAVR